MEFSKSGAQVGEDLSSCSLRRDLSVSPPTAPSLGNSSVERLLFEAQKESSGPSSYINSRASSQERLKSYISVLFCEISFISVLMLFVSKSMRCVKKFLVSDS